MAEKIEEVAVEETESDVEGTGSDQTKNAQTFTQEQVNKIIAKEKSTWKKTAERERESLTDTEKTLREQITARDEVIEKSVELLKKDLAIDEDDWQEISEGRDALWQYNYLLKKAGKENKQDIPRSAQGEGRMPQAPFKRTQTV